MFFTFIRNFRNNNKSADFNAIDTFLKLLKENFFYNKPDKFSLNNGHDILTLDAEDDFYVLESPEKNKKWLFHKTGSLLPIAVSEIDKKQPVNTKLSLNFTVLEDIYKKPEIGSSIAIIRENLSAYAKKRYLEDKAYSGWGKYFGGYSKQEKMYALEALYQGNNLTLQDVKILKQGRIGKILRKSMKVLDNERNKKTIDALLKKIGYEFDFIENEFIIPSDALGRSYVEQMGKVTGVSEEEKDAALSALRVGDPLTLRQANILKKLREKDENEFDKRYNDKSSLSDDFASFLFDYQYYTYDSQAMIFQTKNNVDESILNASHTAVRLVDDSSSQDYKLLEGILLPEDLLPIEPTAQESKSWLEKFWPFKKNNNKVEEGTREQEEGIRNQDLDVIQGHGIEVDTAVLTGAGEEVILPKQFQEWRQEEQRQREYLQQSQQRRDSGGIFGTLKCMFFDSRRPAKDAQTGYTSVQNGTQYGIYR